MAWFSRKRAWSTVEASIDWRVLRPDGAGLLTWFEDDSFVFKPFNGQPVRFEDLDLVRWQLRTMTVGTMPSAYTHRSIHLIGARGLLDATLKVLPKDDTDRWMERLRSLDGIFEDRAYDFGDGRFLD